MCGSQHHCQDDLHQLAEAVGDRLVKPVLLDLASTAIAFLQDEAKMRCRCSVLTGLGVKVMYFLIVCLWVGGEN